MFRLLFVFFILLFVNLRDIYSLSPNQRLNNLKNELNREFGLSIDSDIIVITVTRTPINAGPSALISHLEFEHVLALLYASCVYSGNFFIRWWKGSKFAEAPRYSNNNISLNTVINNSRSLSAIELDSIKSIQQRMGEYFLSNNANEKSKLIIFNEMFFSQVMPLNVNQKDFIKNCLCNLSIHSPYTILYPNFLYTEQRSITGTDIAFVFTNMENAKNSGKMNISDNDFSRCRSIISTIPNNGIIHNKNFLINETYSINGGRVLTRYKKVGYFHENDQCISSGMLYDSGPGYDEAFGTFSQLQQILLRNISTDICLDLNIGIRRNNPLLWRNPIVGALPQDSNLHIVQSNSIDPFYTPQNVMNLPRMRGIIHADKFPYPSWNSPSTNRPQDIFLPYYNGTVILDDIIGCKEEFHLRFVGNDYRFTFIKI